MSIFSSIGHFFSKIGKGIEHGFKEVVKHPLTLLAPALAIPGVGEAIGLGSVGSLLGGGTLGTIAKLGDIAYSAYSLFHTPSMPSVSPQQFDMSKIKVDVPPRPQKTKPPEISFPSYGVKYNFAKQANLSVPRVDVQSGYVYGSGSRMKNQPQIKIHEKNISGYIGNSYIKAGYFGNDYVGYEPMATVIKTTKNIAATQYAPPGFEAVIETQFSPEAMTKHVTSIVGFKDTKTGKVYKLPPLDQFPVEINYKPVKYGNVSSKAWLAKKWEKAGLGKYATESIISSTPFVQRIGINMLGNTSLTAKQLNVANSVLLNAPNFSVSGITKPVDKIISGAFKVLDNKPNEEGTWAETAMSSEPPRQSAHQFPTGLRPMTTGKMTVGGGSPRLVPGKRSENGATVSTALHNMSAGINKINTILTDMTGGTQTKPQSAQTKPKTAYDEVWDKVVKSSDNFVDTMRKYDSLSTEQKMTLLNRLDKPYEPVTNKYTGMSDIFDMWKASGKNLKKYSNLTTAMIGKILYNPRTSSLITNRLVGR